MLLSQERNQWLIHKALQRVTRSSAKMEEIVHAQFILFIFKELFFRVRAGLAGWELEGRSFHKEAGPLLVPVVVRSDTHGHPGFICQSVCKLQN